jgi:hypothetical protein
MGTNMLAPVNVDVYSMSRRMARKYFSVVTEIFWQCEFDAAREHRNFTLPSQK